MNIEYLLPPAIVALVATVLLVAMVWLQRQPTPAHRTFRLILVSTIAWGLVIFLMRSSPDTEGALVWDRLIPAIMAINYCLFYLFSLRLTGSAGSRLRGSPGSWLRWTDSRRRSRAAHPNRTA